MSMLTPPGMGSGKKYRITGERYPRMRPRRQRRRYVLTAIATLAVLGLLSYGALQLADVFREDSGANADQSDAVGASPVECEAEDSEPVPLPEPDAVTVNVYNTTDRAGLAQETAESLAERGFAIGEVDNAPEEPGTEAPEIGMVRGSELTEESGALQLLGSHLSAGDATTDAGPDGVELADGEVELLLGEGFDELAGEDEVSATLEALAEAVQPDDAECGHGSQGEKPDGDDDRAGPLARAGAGPVTEANGVPRYSAAI